ncbi:hemerythrin domain-containing protein [Actinobacillus equuli]|uniref:hemerythrin domain-containing protein n=1 Tax=Actinobacillus equuli TaxID=718 RepID=UPI0024423A62|nr:hemerythrin domain-containing protein [Actinobacillus equuli]WGE42993.1 hemerythrin domain-containing protein [Actinobacillus equuli subsp. haemolyticus]WGE47387.1 hemerythrin domain-containing protein [Actinobacillus equuli subsp. haemolyticus]WGE53710.1 hemerythrin domain-containing protein [Actinobacillus equuli subsp. haemolyticus]WGE59892.1 hemerythrin domain-containing protein [Actinobacillus equuli subsp. haemolyticus]WGE61464.1 hemerythrin domain-containing protein [Actinobacillus e
MQQLEPQQFASWAEPIDMLYACHSKVKRFCKQLQILPEYLAKHGVNQAVKNDVQQILNYFNLSAPLHHEDEECDFFPALLQVQPQAQAEVDELENQHELLHRNWALLSLQLEALVAGERNEVDPELIARFTAGYDVHIAIEEPLFELGRSHLAQSELEKMGKVMADRRKTSP